MVQETERGLVQGSEEAEMVLSDGLLPHPQNPSLYYPVLLLYFQMCRIINLLVMVIVRLPQLQCKFLKGRDFFDSFIDMLSTIKEYLAHSRCSVNNNGWRRDGWILVRCEGLGHGIKISPLASAWVHGWMVGAS